jgi:aspartyl aminopeptidase
MVRRSFLLYNCFTFFLVEDGMKPIARLAFLLLLSLMLSHIALSQSVWQMKPSGWQQIDDVRRQEVVRFNEAYKDYLRRAQTELSSTREVIRLARAAGFVEYSTPDQVKTGAKLIFNNRDRAVALAVIGKEPVRNGSRLIATHHDSPRIDVKARPMYESQGFVLFKTIYHGGIKKYQWTNVPLALDGRVDLKDGRTIVVEMGKDPEDPVFVIPDAAPHSDAPYRGRTYTGVVEAEELNPVVGSIPDETGRAFNETMKAIFNKYGMGEEDFVSAELSLVPAYPPRDVGFDRGLTAAFGQDDRLSSYLAARAMIGMERLPKYTAIAYLTDNEEVGSGNNTGAGSAYLRNLYATLVAAQLGENYSDVDSRKAMSNAQVISADVTDGVNPIFLQGSELVNAARLGQGVTIKRFGRGSDANSEFTARIRKLLDDNNIPYQTHTYKVDVGSGGTIAGFLSREDMEVIDLGVPILSMHSPYELSSKVDVWNFYRAMTAFYQQ